MSHYQTCYDTLSDMLTDRCHVAHLIECPCYVKKPAMVRNLTVEYQKVALNLTKDPKYVRINLNFLKNKFLYKNCFSRLHFRCKYIFFYISSNAFHVDWPTYRNGNSFSYRLPISFCMISLLPFSRFVF